MSQDSGAHFQKCDLQVHSIRDAGWHGPFDAVTERKEFATALIRSARQKGLRAIAITDHHDLCMWKFVRDAAVAELDSTGALVAADKQVVVFPGVELTLSTPASQALLIFDPDLSPEILNHVWGALRVTPAPDDNPKTTQTQALPTEMDLNEIHRALSTIRTNPTETNPAKFQTMEGRFILLPHVRKGGHQSFIRDGFHAHFKNMHCVGGYIEGRLYSELEEGNRAILEGKNTQWGNRGIGVFQTSDCRKATKSNTGGIDVIDFETLGIWPTWIKWSRPSAEALRQACLAKQSRISHVEPQLPTFQISGVQVTDSKFLGPVDLLLNPQFNAFIGGRGTGKSTLLEYIRWALCDDPIPVEEGNDRAQELPNFQRRRKALIEGTLKPLNAKISVFYTKNGVTYRIDRLTASKDEVVDVTGPDGKSFQMKGEQVRKEFPIVSYAQKQLSCVGTMPDEINRLITDPVRTQLDEINRKIVNDLLPRLREHRAREVRKAILDEESVELDASVKAKKEQVLSLQSQLKPLTPDQQKIINAHEKIERQQQLLTQISKNILQASEILNASKQQLEALDAIQLPAELVENSDLKLMVEAFSAFIKKVVIVLGDQAGIAESDEWRGAELGEIVKTFESVYESHVQEYNKCISETSRNEKQLEEIKSLNTQIKEGETKIAANAAERQTLASILFEAGDEPFKNWARGHEERSGVLRVQCEQMNSQAQNFFRSKMHFCGNHRVLIAELDKIVAGRNIRNADIKVLAVAKEIVNSPNPLQKWQDLMLEFDALIRSKGSPTLPVVPVLTKTGFSTENLQAIGHNTAEDVEQIRYVVIEDQIEFEFFFGKEADGSDRFIPFETASPGQQATCLLRALFSQTGTPLLIDQPEEDLDNEQIHALSGRISETKHNRQLLFVSHNANIVVNGDAELVVCFDYRNLLDPTKGKIDKLGSIDSEPIRNSITSIMEGGREAFELRKEKYGF